MNRFILILTLVLTPATTVIANTCEPTPHRTTGTHYEPVTQSKVNISQGVVVMGKILQSPDCEPVGGAKIAHWQADENGEYVDRLRAYLYSDENGHYQFETEWPNLSIPHIHFIVTKDGYEVLETQWVGSQKTELIEFNLIVEKR